MSNAIRALENSRDRWQLVLDCAETAFDDLRQQLAEHEANVEQAKKEVAEHDAAIAVLKAAIQTLPVQTLPVYVYNAGS